MLVVVQLGAEDNVKWAICGGDASRQGRRVEPHQGEGHNLDDHT